MVGEERVGMSTADVVKVFGYFVESKIPGRLQDTPYVFVCKFSYNNTLSF